MQLQRDFGAYPSAHSAFMLNLSLESLDVRMRRHCENAQKVAEYLFTRDDVLTVVRYPGLPSSPYNDLAEKYLEGATGDGPCDRGSTMFGFPATRSVAAGIMAAAVGHSSATRKPRPREGAHRCR